MKKFFILFILLIPFLSYAESNDDYCNISNIEIDNLTKSNNYDNIYNYLNSNYYKYISSCGISEKINSLVSQYITLADNNLDTINIDKYRSILKTIRPSITDEKHFNIIKKLDIYLFKDKKANLLSNDEDSHDSSSDLTDYDINQLNKIDTNLANYYKVDTNHFCGADGEGTYECTFKYTYNKPLKVSGTLTVSNLYNTENSTDPNYFKASFKADNMDIDFSKLFVVPINYKLNTKIPKNYLQTGAAGEITFNVDFILDKDSVIIKGESTVGDITSIYVKNLNINSVKNIRYYDKTDIESYAFPDVIETYELTAKDSYTNLRDKPNGKVVYQIKFNHNDLSDDRVYFYEGYKEPGIDGYRLGYGYPSANYLYNYYKILGFSKPISNNWFFVTYFPKNSTKPVFGYVHSSEINYNGASPDFFEKVNGIEKNINKLSYKEIFDILHNIIGEDVYINRLYYIENQKFQSLINRYVSILLSDNFIFTSNCYDMIFINSLYYYINDNTYYKIIDKYIKDLTRYNKLDKTKRVADKFVYKYFSPKYASYFKQIVSKSVLEYNFDIEMYGILDVNEYINSFNIEKALYTFNAPNPVKITGKAILDPIDNLCSFKFDGLSSKDISLDIIPDNYIVNKEVFTNLLSKGYFGKVSFDVEITLSNKSLLSAYSINEPDFTLYVDSITIKNANNISYYDKRTYDELFIQSKNYTDIYVVFSNNGSAKLLESPNGNVLVDIKNNSKVYVTNFYTPGMWNNILNYKNSMYAGKYYKVIYFPDGVTDGSKALSGYIDSSQLRKVRK